MARRSAELPTGRPGGDALASAPMNRSRADIAGWAASGAMALTGEADGPPSPGPAALHDAMVSAGEDLAVQTARWGRAVVVDGPALLGERAAITGMTRNGSVSVGGTARFVPVADGWVVLNLPRPEDVASLPALVRRSVAVDDWPALSGALAEMTAFDVVEQATLLGMAVVEAVPSWSPLSPGRELALGGARSPSSGPLVVDLSSLWAGPLAASLLGAAGARVIKVEGRGRPDGARSGPAAFFDLLNSGKECVRLDFHDRDDRRLLRRLLRAADLVVEASRPRVMDELGIVPEVLASTGTSWLSITAHGRAGPLARRVGFGDDAAVAGGLFVPGAPPMFVADAVADPVTGVAAAALGAELLASTRAAVIEVPLVRAAAWGSRPMVDAETARGPDGWYVVVAGERVEVAEPRHRPIPTPASPSGSHDAAVRAEFASDPG